MLGLNATRVSCLKAGAFWDAMPKPGKVARNRCGASGKRRSGKGQVQLESNTLDSATLLRRPDLFAMGRNEVIVPPTRGRQRQDQK